MQTKHRLNVWKNQIGCHYSSSARNMLVLHFGMAFYKASGLKDPKSPHVGPNKGKKRFRDLNENKIGDFIARQ